MSKALFTEKTVKIDTLGEYLKQVREVLNYDIKTVSILTQIKPNYLDILEAGNYHQLPAEVYIRGFLKSLAQFYHINEQILIDQYEKERGFELPLPKTVRKLTQWLVFTPKTLIIWVSLFVALGAATYVGLQIRSVLAPPYLSLTEPSGDQTVTENSIVVAGVAEVGAEVFINDQPVLTDATGAFTETLILSSGVNIVEVSEKNKFGKISKITRAITSQAQDTKSKPSQEVNLTVNIGPGNAWVYLEADGVVVQRGTMLSGSTKTIAAKNEIILTSANAGATQVIYNGKDLGILGRVGEVIRNVEFASGS